MTKLYLQVRSSGKPLSVRLCCATPPSGTLQVCAVQCSGQCAAFSAHIGLIWVKEEGRTGFSKGWQGCSEGFPEGKARGKSRGAALPARGKPRPSRLFYSDLHSISNTVFQSPEVSRRVNFFNAILVHFWCQIVNFYTTFFSWIFYAEYFLWIIIVS